MYPRIEKANTHLSVNLQVLTKAKNYIGILKVLLKTAAMRKQFSLSALLGISQKINISHLS